MVLFQVSVGEGHVTLTQNMLLVTNLANAK